MGLRHNFVASTFMTNEQLANPSVTSVQGTSASVMDYVPVNMVAVANGKGDFYSRSIGSYDLFAIEYGYRDVPGKTALGEKPHLMRIAMQGSLPGHLYMTDENADGFDPYVVRFDNSKEPIKNAGLTISVAKKLLAKADKNYPKPGRPYSDLTRVVNMAIMQTARQCFSATRFVGGVAGRRNFAGDPGERPTLAPVDPGLQRAAIQLIAKELLSENSFQLSHRMLVNLSGDPDGPYNDAPIKDVITMIQSAVVSSLLSANTTQRVANNAYKLAGSKDRFTLSELYSTVVGSVFSEVAARRPVGMLRRDLQRFVVDALSTQALARPGAIEEDARMLAWHHLRSLSKKLAAGGSKDEMTAMHMTDLRRRIERTEKSVVTSGG
ncbi:MAG: zinc-dependent metalloprotease, partial [Armatimonadetes bacterium]|nr:zinc-dependent metalloprotease [Armatimonadota bacterium]